VNIKLLRPAVAELVGTALFVLIGAGSVVVNAAHPGAVGGLGVAAAHGIALAVAVSAVMNISGGHLNPAVSIALWAARKLDAPTTGVYIAAQLMGGALGAALVKWVLPRGAVAVTNAGLPLIAANVTRFQGYGIEALLTFFLMTAVLGTAVSRDAPKVAGFAIGLAVFAAGLVAGPLTGAVLNPARAFGPALVSLEFHAQAVYWIGPILGATLAAVLWKAILLPREG
jgi:MIP family channel proteins